MSATSVQTSGAELAAALDVRDFLAAVVVANAFPIRQGGKLHAAQGKAYSDAMKAGQVFPPIEVMRVAGTLYLVDGFHRLAAARAADKEQQLEVKVLPDGTLDEARWRAFVANRQHGLPLKRKDLRAGFRAYIKTRQHRSAKGPIKSYRD